MTRAFAYWRRGSTQLHAVHCLRRTHRGRVVICDTCIRPSSHVHEALWHVCRGLCLSPMNMQPRRNILKSEPCGLQRVSPGWWQKPLGGVEPGNTLETHCCAGRRLTLAGDRSPSFCDHLGTWSNAACGVHVCVCLRSQLYAGSGLPTQQPCMCSSAQAPDAEVFLSRRSLNLRAAVSAQRSFLLTKQSLCVVHTYPGCIDLSQILTNNQANAL